MSTLPDPFITIHIRDISNDQLNLVKSKGKGMGIYMWAIYI